MGLHPIRLSYDPAQYTNETVPKVQEKEPRKGGWKNLRKGAFDLRISKTCLGKQGHWQREIMGTWPRLGEQQHA